MTRRREREEHDGFVVVVVVVVVVAVGRIGYRTKKPPMTPPALPKKLQLRSIQRAAVQHVAVDPARRHLENDAERDLSGRKGRRCLSHRKDGGTARQKAVVSPASAARRI